MINEISYKPLNGYLMFGVLLLMIAAAIIPTALYQNPAFALIMILPIMLTVPGFFIVNPNSSKALTLFGKYKGTVKQDGFHWANPFLLKRRVSLRARNLDTEKIKVNDKLGNPIIISAVVVWQVSETALALFEVDDYEHYVRIQSDAAVRDMAGKYSYDDFDDDVTEITLRSGGAVVNAELETELIERLQKAGVEVIEARITHLAYSEEIAGAMLQRQQATAIIAARQKIVDGAVGMVEMALERLERENIVNLDEERKAAMISNLLVVLCSEKSTSPVVNTGSLY